MTGFDSMVTRRTMLRTSVAASGALATGTLLASRVSAQTPVRVRRNIYGATDKEKMDLVTGVSAMKKLGVLEKLSWLYQANIHGTTDRPLQTAWATCQHGNQFFVSWHRMYVYYFERILRKACKDDSFNLPYWDYENSFQRVMPEMFRVPANVDENPLYVSQRGNVNQGVPLPVSAVSATKALEKTEFFPFNSQVEQQPHNAVHVAIGGWMANVQLAARDPIFWLHHCNIDRLWAKWNALGDGRKDPSSGDWSTREFEFYDENGDLVKMSGKDVVDTALQLDYRYDDEPVVAQSDKAMSQSSRSQSSEPPARPERVLALTAARREPALALGVNDAVITLQPDAAGGRNMLAEIAQPSALAFDGISYKQAVGVYYELYLNKPSSAPYDPNGPYFAGNLSFFAVGHNHSGGEAVEGASVIVDIGSILSDQIKNKLWSGRDLHIDLHPQTGGLTNSEKGATLVSIGQVKLLSR